MLIYIIEDDPDWQLIYRNLFKQISTKFFPDGVSAMDAIDEQLPDRIILDMLLPGPSAPSLLTELQSYQDTAQIPVAIVSSLAIPTDLSPYGVTKVFDKSTMHPQELLQWISKPTP